MSDKLVFDLAQEIEGSPNIFIRKDWLNILDNQSQNYNGNQSIIDTSQLSNSNKWMNYREAYLSVPMIITLATTGQPTATTQALPPVATASPGSAFAPATCLNFPTNSTTTTTQTGSSNAIGLKNWFGTMIHSFTLDYNGTTVIQQTPFINLWNNFRLMTSLSWSDVQTQGTVIGFYPDTATTFTYTPATAQTIVADGAGGFLAPGATTVLNGQGTCNNTVKSVSIVAQNTINNDFDIGGQNVGFYKRMQNINFDLDGLSQPRTGSYNSVKLAAFFNTAGNLNVAATSSTSAGSFVQSWKNYIFNKQNQVIAGGGTVQGIVQYAICATIYLKHVHSFFNMVPLLKGTFMKMTLNLNNTTTTFVTQSSGGAGAGPLGLPTALVCTGVTTAFGGANPIMIASAECLGLTYPTVSNVALTNLQNISSFDNGSTLFPQPVSVAAVNIFSQEYSVNISVGATCLNSQLASTQGVIKSLLSQSVYLYVPSYTFNSPFEQAYLSQSVKTIKYTDVYQYQVLNVGAGSQFNNLITNGISNIKSVLVLPFFSSSSANSVQGGYPGLNVNLSSASGFLSGLPVWQSPFDPAGGGPTSPLVQLTNFNVQVAGQNAIYNTQVRSFEEFNNQLYGCNAVNGGLTDGLTSGLVGRQEFDMQYCYYYVNVERMLPVEETVPKSVNIIGQNNSAFSIDLIVWVEYGNEIKIDPLTGARV